jgi:chorismate synthase
MAGNTFGTIFKVTTWGESHGPAIGAVIDGCPSNLKLSENDIQKELDRRKPGKGDLSSTRKEKDIAKILSGIFKGKTLGTPISVIVENTDVKSKDYENLKHVFRPGHADYTYFVKYGIRDYRGGGRASGRETIGRVIGGAIAKKILEKYKIKIIGRALKIGKIIKNDSAGGIVEIIIKNVPAGLGEPVFDKLDGELAKAIFSIGAVKGVEIGSGFESADMKGSKNNDLMYTSVIPAEAGIHQVKFKTNNSGGILGGISTGQDIIIRAAVKPTPSISIPQKTVDEKGKNVSIKIQGRHDICIVPRIIAVIESMAAITLADFILKK